MSARPLASSSFATQKALVMQGMQASIVTRTKAGLDLQSPACIYGLRALVDLSDAYALCAARADFDRKLVQFMGRHGKRDALVRRVADASLWKKSAR